jgi:hypothetical protein
MSDPIPFPPASRPSTDNQVAGRRERSGAPAMRVVKGGIESSPQSEPLPDADGSPQQIADAAAHVPARADMTAPATGVAPDASSTRSSTGRSSELPEWLVTDDLSGIPLLTDEVVASPSRRLWPVRSLGWAFAAGAAASAALFFAFMRVPAPTPTAQRAAAAPPAAPLVPPPLPSPPSPPSPSVPAVATTDGVARPSASPASPALAKPAKPPASVTAASPETAPVRRPPPARSAASARSTAAQQPGADNVRPAAKAAACAPEVAALGLCVPDAGRRP